MNRKLISASAALLLGSISGWSAAQEGESLCTEPGLTILEDATGDVDVGGILPAGLPLSYADLVSLQVAQPISDDGKVRLVFTLKLAGALPPVLPPMSAWYTSFKGGNAFYGVRMYNDESGTVQYQSYSLGANNDGGSDGRFTEVIKPAESGNFSGDTITITVAGSDIGIRNAGDSLKQFNAGSVQSVSPQGMDLVAAVLDGAPDDLSRRGELTTVESCSASKSGLEKLGGALNFALLLPLLGFGLLRRRRA